MLRTARGVLARLAAAVFFGIAACGVATAQPADTILMNGKIVTADDRFTIAQAVAIRGDRLVSVGSTVEARRFAGPKTRIVDLEGRTVVPGLIDSHMHAIRAALSFSREVNWIGATSLEEALGRLRDAARVARPGQWLIVAGGWTPDQFRERRRPTQAELVAAAPDHPVYVQLFYEWALLSPRALEALNISGDGDVLPAGRVERDAAGVLTGGIAGDGFTITRLFDRLPTPTFADSVEGTIRFFRELNRHGLTGVVDPGGFNMAPESYLPLFRVWREGKLSLRVTYSLFAQQRGKELDEFRALTQLLPPRFGDDLLRFNGIGERVTFGMYNNAKPTEADKEAFYRVAKWAAERGYTLNQHWHDDSTVGHLLDVFERVNREVPIAPLRWAIAHLNDGSRATFDRMKALGVGWAMQNALYYEGERFLERRGEELARRAPPLRTAMEAGVEIGAGTDAHRVASYNPFVALQWMLDGRAVTGRPIRGAAETPTRGEALRMYTRGSAWLAHDESRRGSLEVGKFADLAVLTADYLTVPLERIGAIRSVLTMVGGRVVYADGGYALLESD